MSVPLREIAERALEAARRHGAHEVAVRAGRTRYTSLRRRARRLEKVEAATTQGLSVTLYVDGRFSANGTSDLRPEAVDAFCGQLVAMTRQLTPDRHRGLPECEYYAGRVDRDLGLVDTGYERLTQEARQDYAAAAESAALDSGEGIISVTASFNDRISDSVRIHSNGFLGTRRSTLFGANTDVSVRGVGDRKPKDSWHVAAHAFDELPPPAEIGQRAAARARAAVGAAKIESARLPLLVENRAAGTLLRHLLGPMSAGALQQRRSCLEGKVGQSVASDRLTLIDDPHIPGGMGSRLYDGEGITARRRIMFERGVLKNLFVDVYYGRKLGLRATSATRSNLLFEGGGGDLEQLTREVGHGVLVTGFLGGNSNPATGDFSLGVRGHLIEDGQRTQPVAEMNITDNLLSFWKRLSAVGADPYPYTAVLTPSLCFDGVQFSGA